MDAVQPNIVSRIEIHMPRVNVLIAFVILSTSVLNAFVSGVAA